jgi:hypothetical protein
VWTEARTGQELYDALFGLPGIGEMKAHTLVAILGKRFAITPEGWQAFAPDHMTLGDVDSPEALRTYQEGKRAWKASLREAKD